MSGVSDIRYDRQIRLWGDQGQACIEHANVCLLGSSATGCEVLKSLVLAGIGSIHIVDNSVITEPDIGNNFFTQGEIGQSRAKIALRGLLEMNLAVKGDCDLRSVEEFLETDIAQLSRYAVVVGACLSSKLAFCISNYLWPLDIPFVIARTYGFVGMVRVSVREHTIINTREEHSPPDLRLDCPFLALEEMVKETKLDEMTYEEHSHTPYAILYLIALERWRQKYGAEKFPDNFEERKSFEEVYLSLRMPRPENGSLDEENFMEGRAAIVRSLRRTVVPSNTKAVLEHPKAQEPDRNRFWVLVAALRRFVIEHEGLLPVNGQLPDMISDTKRYVKLVDMYREKAHRDVQEVFSYVSTLTTKKGLPNDMVKFVDCEFFCKNAAFLSIYQGTSGDQEVETDLQNVFDDIQKLDLTPNAVTGVMEIPPATWYILLRAIDRFYDEKSRYPGTNGVPCSIDAHDLNSRVMRDISNFTCESNLCPILSKISQEAIDEMCRYGASEPHVIASIVGGIAAQEVIKLATHQYVPLDNTFIFDGHSQQSQTYRL